MLHICLDNRSDALAVTTGDDDNVEPPQPVQRSQKASESRYTFVGQLPVGEKLTVLQLKQLLFHLLTGKQQSGASTASSSSEGCGWDNLGRSSLPASPHHLRLKDFPRGKLSAPLRDDRQLMKCLLVENWFTQPATVYHNMQCPPPKKWFTLCFNNDRVSQMGGKLLFKCFQRKKR